MVDGIHLIIAQISSNNNNLILVIVFIWKINIHSVIKQLTFCLAILKAVAALIKTCYYCRSNIFKVKQIAISNHTTCLKDMRILDIKLALPVPSIVLPMFGLCSLWKLATICSFLCLYWNNIFLLGFTQNCAVWNSVIWYRIKQLKSWFSINQSISGFG